MATTEPTTDTGQTPENNQKETTHMSKAQGQFTIIDYRQTVFYDRKDSYRTSSD